MSASPLKRRMWIGGAVVALLFLGVATVFAVYTWGEVQRVSIERPLSEDSGGPVAQEEEPDAQPGDDDDIELVDPGNQVYLLVGSDSREDLTDTSGFGEFTGNRADVIMVLFKEETRTGLLSVPRDLLIDSPCDDSTGRISEMLDGCDPFNGPTLLTIAVERLIGRSIDHFALVDLAGFQQAVDALDGYEICVDNPVRDERADLALPAGCTDANGHQTLAWLRSRHTQELTDDGWRTMPGVNDLSRNERQREFLIDMMGRVGDFSSPQAMMSVAQAVAPHVTVDSELSMIDAVSLAWTMRGLQSGSIVEMEIPVLDATTEDGAAVLRASEPVADIVDDFLDGASASTGSFVGAAS